MRFKEGDKEMPLGKFRGTDIIPFIVGMETAIRFIARKQGLL